ncbi:hypothetical protein TMEC54S_03527 [Thauera mechernichensis]
MSGDWNFHAAEASIVEQLRQACQAGAGAWAREIGTRGTLADTSEEMQHCPAIYVVYDGYVVTQADVQRAIIQHRWVVVVAVSNATPGRDASPRTQDAGPMVGDVFMALHGFLPVGSVEAMIPATPPRPFFSPARFAYFPVAFTTIAHHNTRRGVASARPTLATPAAFPHP